jgi:hypothetical protein
VCDLILEKIVCRDLEEQTDSSDCYYYTLGMAERDIRNNQTYIPIVNICFKEHDLVAEMVYDIAYIITT